MESNMHYLIAIDGGGTKTQAVLFQENGIILASIKEKGTNPLDIGEEVARRRISELINQLVFVSPESVSAIYAGIAGMVYYNDFFGDDMRRQISCCNIKIETDGRNLISSELYNDEDGCCLIVGTGCGTWVRNHNYKEIFHVGGWGYLVDTLGSGYSIGREVVRAVCLEMDGRGRKTILSELLEKETNLKFPSYIPFLYSGGRTRFASLAHLAFEGKRMSDKVCSDIIDEGAKKLSELIWTVDHYFEDNYPVIVGGGVVTIFPEYFDLIKMKCPNRSNLILAKNPPIFGAAVEAMHQAGLRLPQCFRKNFCNYLAKN